MLPGGKSNQKEEGGNQREAVHVSNHVSSKAIRQRVPGKHRAKKRTGTWRVGVRR